MATRVAVLTLAGLFSLAATGHVETIATNGTFTSVPTTPFSRPSGPLPATKDTAGIVENYGQLPLSFEANYGQTNSEVKFLVRDHSYSLFLTNSEAVLALRASKTGHYSVSRSSVLRFRLLGVNGAQEIQGEEELPGKSNYFVGNDPKKWRTNVPHYAKVRYRDIYPGVDLVYHGASVSGRQLENDFVVAPDADPSQIKFVIEGPEKIELDSRGDLVLHLIGTGAEDAIRLCAPNVYQEIHGTKHPVEGGYVLKGAREIVFHIAPYDRKLPLVIDPVLIYSGFLGGDQFNEGNSIAVDPAGNAYLTGYTGSLHFPTTTGSFETAPGGRTDAFVTKLNAMGTALVYSTYLGGSAEDIGYSIAVDSTGNAYVTGHTVSTDFPVTPGAFKTVPLGVGGNCGNVICGDAFVSKLNAMGTALAYSTYLGGSGDDTGAAIALDTAGNAYVTGATASNDFPTTAGAFQTAPGGVPGCGQASCGDAFVTKLNATGTALTYSTYLGGDGSDTGAGIALDTAEGAYVAGSTASSNFPTTPGAFQTAPGTAPGCGSNGICGDAFVSKLNATGTALVYSTYLGGRQLDNGSGIAVDGLGNAYVTGDTISTDFPTTPGAFQTVLPIFGNACAGLIPCSGAFITKLNATGTALVYSTFLGSSTGNGASGGSGIALDSIGNVYVTGSTGSPDFPILNPIQAIFAGAAAHSDAFVTELNPTGSALIYSTYLGGTANDSSSGVAVDSSLNVYIVGTTFSDDFPLTPGAFELSFQTGSPLQATTTKAFVAKIANVAAPGLAVGPGNLNFGGQLVGTTSAPQTVLLLNAGSAALAITNITASGDFAQANTCGSSLAAGTACSLTATFTPTSAGNFAGAIVVNDNASGSPQMISLTGTGDAPAEALSPTSLSFPSQIVGTTSSAQNLTLTNTGTAALIITSIAASGDFGETNTCGFSVLAGANCSISVTFTPTAVGNRSGTLTITDNVAGSPHAVTLSGTGTGDFSVSVASPSATVAAGQSATYTLSIGSLSGFNQSISLSCSGAPQQAVCSVSPASVTPTGASAATATVTVTTMARGIFSPTPGAPTLPPVAKGQPGLVTVLLLLAILLRRWARNERVPLAFAAIILALLSTAGCGGGSSMSQQRGTPAGTYTVTVTATSGGTNHTIPLTLTVN